VNEIFFSSASFSDLLAAVLVSTYIALQLPLWKVNLNNQCMSELMSSTVCRAVVRDVAPSFMEYHW
jgi:hypothetical protein